MISFILILGESEIRWEKVALFTLVFEIIFVLSLLMTVIRTLISFINVAIVKSKVS